MARNAGACTPAQRDAFFAGLPPDEFSPLETALRQCLLDFLAARGDAAFPLIEWIDRRLGGEIATVRDEHGQGEIRLVGAALVSSEVFFERLPQDAFSPDEEALREAIFDFLASWKSSALAHAGDLAGGAAIKERCAAFMPPDVKLEEWIERRIGGEVQLVKDAKTGKQVIHLTPSARPIVAAKYEALQKAEGGRGKGAPAKAPLSRAAPGVGPGAGPSVGLPGKGGAKDRGKSPPARAPLVDKEEWLNALPSDQLTAEEAAMREALLAFLRDWPRRRPGGRAGAPILFQEAGQDPEVVRCRSALLPPSVPLKDWIDRRIGGEVEIRKDELGQMEILLRGSKPAVAAAAVAEVVADVAMGLAPGKGGKAAVAPVGKSAPPGGAIEAFFARLPGDELTEAELDLRQAVLTMIEARAAEGTAPHLVDVCKDRAIVQARTALMPDEVPLRQWLERRVGGEFEVFKDARGTSCIKMRGAVLPMVAAAAAAPVHAGGAEAPPAEAPREDGRERFFESLPSDHFTPEEEKLREALLAFLDMWKSRDPPTLSHTGADAEVRRSRALVLPKGTPVSLKDWIDRRMGGELEMVEQEGTGMIYFGHRGTLDAEAIAALGVETRKRVREEAAAPSKGAPLVRGKDGGKGPGKAGEQWWKRPREEPERAGGKSAPRGGPSARAGPRW